MINVIEHTIDIPTDLAANILAYAEQNPDSNQCSNRGGYQKDYQDNPPEWILETFNQVKALLPQFTVKRAWMNINGPGHSNRWHRHHIDGYTAVLYVYTPANCGKMEFRHEQEDYPVEPVVGKFVAFPSDYTHCVYENKSGENRISLAFNLIPN